jgi:hypothetical protein
MKVKSRMLILIEPHVIENEELRLRAEIRRIRQPAVLQIAFGFTGDPARVALIVLPRNGIDHVAGHHQRANLPEGIDERGARVRDEQHVALVDGRPTADAGSINAETLFKRVWGELADGIGDVLLQTGQIREAQIHLAHFFAFRKLQNFLGIHFYPPEGNLTGTTIASIAYCFRSGGLTSGHLESNHRSRFHGRRFWTAAILETLETATAGTTEDLTIKDQNDQDDGQDQ